MRLSLLAAACAALALASHPSPAEACSLPAPLGWVTLLPADGEAGIPTNAQIHLDYQVGYDFHGSLDQVTVRPIGGAPVSLAITEEPSRYRSLVVATPTAPLAAGTTYEILIPFMVPCYEFSSPCTTDLHVIGTFTTGAGPDVTPPVFGGLDSLSAFWEACEDEACCGPYRGFNVGFSFTPATDDGPPGWVRYNLYRDGALVARMKGSYISGWFDCGSVPYAIGPWYDTPMVSGAPYVVRAVDLAGNEEGNEQARSLVLDCASGPIDAGPDTGPGPDVEDNAVDGGTGGGGDVDEAGGCTCDAGGAGGGFGSALLALATLCLAGLLGRGRARGSR